MTVFNKTSPLLDVISLKVKDSEKSLQFYCDYLGLDMIIEENNIAYLGSKATGRPMVALYEYPEGIESLPEQNVLARFAISVPTNKWFTDIKERLLKADYEFSAFKSESNHDVIRVLDPENHTLDLLNMNTVNPYLEAQAKKHEGIIKPTFFLRGPAKTHEELEIHAVRLAVADIVESHKFYTEILGFTEKLDEKGLKLEVNPEEEDYLRLATSSEKIATDDNFLGLDYLAFRLPDKEELEKYVAFLKDKGQDVYYNKRQGLLQIDDPDGNHLWFYR
ncbi:hypothetical protein G7081_04440 [Vagococcus coleopterorum]|uniref:VOC domain-containing protein n=1 Tax=Vagococcus coleopterorum TaxID=2714946 RepID=A0A6G8AN62_9ENTE|nr:VOC family protein [Vagococcus coleopterorum]QIL46365.1 hypothetical protein G7081_04440 [Vagococcus coleopterorum]